MPSEEQYKAFLKALGARIRALRKERGITLRDIVVEHDYHDAQWRKYEGGGGLTVKSLLRIAEILNEPVKNLFPDPVEGSSAPGKLKKRPTAKKAKT